MSNWPMGDWLLKSVEHCEFKKLMGTKFMDEWMSVKDGLPEYRQRILVTNGKKIEIATFNNSFLGDKPFNCWYIGWFAGDAGSTFSPEPYSYDKYLDDATHWMPLPELPK